MPTVLLQEIRDLLTAFLTAINTKIEAMLAKLGNIEEDVDNMATDVSDIKDDVDAIKTNSDSLPVIETNTTSIDGKLTNVNLKLDTANGYLSDIKDNTGAVVTPVQNIKLAVDSIKSNSDAMSDDLEDINNFMSVISTNTGKCAGFDEDTATNTLNIYDKIVTIASDTTDIRATNRAIIDILNQIYDKI